MKGKYEVVVRDARLQYKFTLERNITLLRGDSATGKTTLIDMVALYRQDEVFHNGVTIRCEKQCHVLTAMNWQLNLSAMHDSIVFIDEGEAFVRQEAFANAIRKTDNYYVIATRAALPMLPYSIREVYGIRNTSGNRFQGTKRLYSEFYPLNRVDIRQIDRPDVVIVEDSNAGFEFFSAVCAEHGIPCRSAGGKTKMYKTLLSLGTETALVIADGAAFGPELEAILHLKAVKNLIVYLPESFEWLILKSGVIQGVAHILEAPYDHIESRDHFSWERFFTALLSEKTDHTYLAYRKSKLNPVYLQDHMRARILEQMPPINPK